MCLLILFISCWMSFNGLPLWRNLSILFESFNLLTKHCVEALYYYSFNISTTFTVAMSLMLDFDVISQARNISFLLTFSIYMCVYIVCACVCKWVIDPTYIAQVHELECEIIEVEPFFFKKNWHLLLLIPPLGYPNFWYVVFLLSFISKYFLDCFLDHELFMFVSKYLAIFYVSFCY